MKRVYAASKPPPAKPLTILHTPRGVAAIPDRLDEEYQIFWGPIFEGDADTSEARTISFLYKYADYLYKDDEFPVEDITADILRTITMEGSATACGNDGVCPKETKLLPLKAWTWIVKLLQRIEEGDEWPEDTLSARAIFLLKEGNSGEEM